MRQFARGFGDRTALPEAICVTCRVCQTVGALTDPKASCPAGQGRAACQGDRDLKFFDEVLAQLKRITGGREAHLFHGPFKCGGFTYLLWAERGDVFAAVAPSAAVFPNARKLKPKPVMHLAGDKDTLVKYQWQKAMMEAVRRLNGCEAEGKPWVNMPHSIRPSRERRW